MNVFDKPRSRCDAKERDVRWYSDYFQKQQAKRIRRELARQQQQERESQSLSLSQDTLGSQSQEPTLFDSEMRESLSTKPTEDPNKSRNTSRDVILRRLIYTAGGSKADHDIDSSKKKKKHVTSWISKYHFHESLLQNCDKEAQNLKTAAATGIDVTDAINGTDTTTAVVVMPTAQAAVAAAGGGEKGATTTPKTSMEMEVEITNSPPRSPEQAADTIKQRKQTKSATPKKNDIAAVKSEQRKEHKKRSSHDLLEEAKVEEATKSTRAKKRSKKSNSNKKSDVQVVTRHENGHVVLEILDSDDEDVGVLV